MRLLAGALALVLLTTLAACGSSDSDSDAGATTTTKAADSSSTAVEVTDAWARTSPAATTNGAVYLTLKAPTADKLVKASVPTSVAARTELHETVMADESSASTMGEMNGNTQTSGTMGAMTMQQVSAIELPAGETVELKPGGYHIMLFDLVKPLEKGSTVEVTLEFENAPTQTVTAEVRDA